MCVATGSNFFGYPTKPSVVLYIGMEDTVPKLSGRVAKMKQHFSSIENFKFTVLPSDKRNLAAIESLISEIKPGLVMIDPLTNLLSKEDKKEDVEHTLKELDRIIERYGVSVILIHHARKGKGETLESMRGSSALPGWADTICRITRRGNNKYKIKLDFECRHAPEDVEPIDINFRTEDCHFEEDMSLTAGLQQDIRGQLSAHECQMALAELKEELEEKASLRTIERALKGMTDVTVMLDPQDKRRRILRLAMQQTISVRSLQ
jgi:hypothetical protein